MPLEERHLEGEAEQAREPELAGVLLENVEDGMADTPTQPLRRRGKSAHLAEVLPHHVQGAAADDLTVAAFRDAELLHRLVEHHTLLAEQDAALHERLDERGDGRDVARAGTAHVEVGHRPP